MNCILITGANRGIGLELAKQYYHDNWHVIACSRHPENLAGKICNISTKNGKFLSIKCDVTNPTDIQTLSQTLSEFNIDILFNNAGVWGPTHADFGSIQPPPWLEVLNVNVVAPLLLAQALIKQVERSRLKMIVNMSSNMGSIEDNHTGGCYIYRSSKAALNAVTKSMAIDLKSKGITVISLHPGWVKTDMGGDNAPMTVTQSVNNIKRVLSTISLQDSGLFISHDGKKLTW